MEEKSSTVSSLGMGKDDESINDSLSQSPYGLSRAIFSFNSLSSTILPSSISIRNILPGSRRPFLIIVEGSIEERTPTSDASITRSSFVT